MTDEIQNAFISQSEMSTPRSAIHTCVHMAKFAPDRTKSTVEAPFSSVLDFVNSARRIGIAIRGSRHIDVSKTLDSGENSVA